MAKVKTVGGSGIEKVRALLSVGGGLANAVRDALGDRSIAQLALKHAVSRQNLTSALNGGRAPTDREIAALVAELGGATDEWRHWFAAAAQKRALVG